MKIFKLDKNTEELKEVVIQHYQNIYLNNPEDFYKSCETLILTLIDISSFDNELSEAVIKHIYLDDEPTLEKILTEVFFENESIPAEIRLRLHVKFLELL